MLETKWNNCLNLIKERVPEQSFNTWFSPIKALRYEKDVLTIKVPNRFFYEWLEEHFVDVIREAISLEIGKNVKLEYSIDEIGGIHEKQRENIIKKPKETSFDKSVEVLSLSLLQSSINTNNTFENFVEGSCNRFARMSALTVSKNPGTTSFNPIMVHGGIGHGKTHLVQAIGNELKKNHPYLKIIYLSANQFTNLFINALRNSILHDFISFFGKTDVLILDDVQYLENKEKTQEVFFNIFNHLHQLNKQIILTSDKPAKDIRGLHERLVSRLKWGLTTELLEPSLEVRINIIQQMIREDGIEMPEEVVQYIAHTVDTNLRELRGVVVSITAHAQLMDKEVNLELANRILNNLVNKNNSEEVRIDYIQKVVSNYFAIDIKALKEKTRKREVVVARQVAMYFSKHHTNHSLKYIGRHFGGRDHSTVIYALQAVNNLMDVDNKFKTSVLEIKKKLKLADRD